MNMKTLLLVVGTFFLFFCCGKEYHNISDPGWNNNNNDTTAQITIMTYNIHYGYPVGTQAANLQGTATVIKSINPDVALLQEVDIKTNRSGGVDQLAALASLTGMEYYYFGKAIDYNNGQFGVAILSKYKLEDTNTTLLPIVPKQNESDYVEQRAMADAKITVKGHQIMVASTHLDLTQYNRDVQAPAIHSRLSASSCPAVLGGDFNARPTDPIITVFQNLSYTFTSLSGYSISNYLIDYIVYRPAGSFKLKSHQVATSAVNVSDHYPVVDILELQ